MGQMAIPDHLPLPLLLAGSLAGLLAMLAWRVRESRGTVSLRKIFVPPLGMSTGFAMFALPAARVPWAWASGALALGALVFAIPLTRTSSLLRRGDAIVMQRSKAFLWILLGLFAVRFALRSWIDLYVTAPQSGALFFLLAFGMIARWRSGMLFSYLRLRAAAPAPIAARGA
jgi:membrane protein CcdC involved in cytochrome C biogenesis